MRNLEIVHVKYWKILNLLFNPNFKKNKKKRFSMWSQISAPHCTYNIHLLVILYFLNHAVLLYIFAKPGAIPQLWVDDRVHGSIGGSVHSAQSCWLIWVENVEHAETKRKLRTYSSSWKTGKSLFGEYFVQIFSCKPWHSLLLFTLIH